MNRNNLSDAVRRTLVRYPEPHAAHYGVVPAAPTVAALPLDQIQAAAAPHAAAVQALQRAAQIAARLPNHFALSRVLVRQEAVTSSAMEGTHSTLDEVLEAEEGEEPAAQTRQVRDYAIALEHALRSVERRGRAALALPLIRGLHRAVVAADPDYRDRPGYLRRVVVWIGGTGPSNSQFNPPPADRVRQCLAEHIAYLQDDGVALQQSAIVRLAVAHAHFEAIHPFRDGNGRVGRLLIPLMMAADGMTPLYVAPYIAKRKQEYVEGLKAAQQRLDHGPLIAFLSYGITATVAEADRTQAALDQLANVWLQRRAYRKNSAARRALDLLPGYPVISATRLADRLRISFEAANRAIGQLCEVRVLRPSTRQRRNRLFVAREALKIYNRNFGDEPEVPEE